MALPGTPSVVTDKPLDQSEAALLRLRPMSWRPPPSAPPQAPRGRRFPPGRCRTGRSGHLTFKTTAKVAKERFLEETKKGGKSHSSPKQKKSPLETPLKDVAKLYAALRFTLVSPAFLTL